MYSTKDAYKFHLTLAFVIVFSLGTACGRPGKWTKDYHSASQNNVIKMNQNGGTLFGGYRPSSEREFRMLMDNYQHQLQLSGIYSEDSLVKIDLKCDTCKVIFFVLQDLLAQNFTQNAIANVLTKACIELKIKDERVCTGIIQMFKVEVLTVFDKLALSYTEVCGLLLGDGCAIPRDPTAPWNITLPATPKPKPKPPTPPKRGNPSIKILHLTDIHLDMEYEAGANAECGEPVCCRNNSGAIVGLPAGYWGDYRSCDTSPKLVENMLQNIKKRHKFDMIYWTGDLPGHYVWNQTRAGGLSLQDYVTKLFLQYFPGVPVYSAIGNHEGVPVNSFPLPFVEESSIQWLYKTLASNWSHWIPKPALETVQYGGYFSVSYRPGFRIISVNTNYCNNQNWWLLLNETDPVQELQWLVAELQKAEDTNEKVHIVGHIPPGHVACMKSWSWNFYKIVNRYENTISAQFYGHTHFDQMEIFYDEETFSRPTSVAFIGPSVTPYTDVNPGYRIYTVDGIYPNSSFGVLDHENYFMNLTEGNRTKVADWKLIYKASDAYNTSALFPADCQRLLSNLEKNDSLLQQFYRFKYKLHPPANNCDDGCRTSLLCDIKSARSHDPNLCKDLMSQDEFSLKISLDIINGNC